MTHPEAPRGGDNQPQQSQENEKTVAKYYHVENIKQYAIKLSTNNELFNPYSIYDTEKSHSPLHDTIRNSNRFIFVNQTVFEYYLKFLMTKNNAWLKKAERERL